METTVNLKGLTFGYSKRNTLFQNLDLALEPGHIYGMFGKNGTGKTTLLKQMTGLLFPDRGQSTVFGYPPSKRLPGVLQEIFLLPEYFELPPLTTETYRKVHSPLYPNFNHDQFDRHMEDLDIPPNQKLTKLSFGQQKKALLAFALATQTRLLIMDEPTNGLDIPSKSQFRKTLAGAISEEQIVLISTHQVRDLASLIDQVIILENGQIIFQEPIDRINQALSFKEIKEGESVQPLYSEPSFSGHKAILPADKEQTEVDLELLFNGILTAQDTIQEQFKKQ